MVACVVGNPASFSGLPSGFFCADGLLQEFGGHFVLLNEIGPLLSDACLERGNLLVLGIASRATTQTVGLAGGSFGLIHAVTRMLNGPTCV